MNRRPGFDFRWLAAAACLVALCLAACTRLSTAFPSPVWTPPPSPFPSSTLSPLPPSPLPLFPSSTLLPSSPPLLAQTTAAPLPATETPPSAAPPLAASPKPLRFVYPTPGPAPVSAWRPPLYPVPWAPTLFDHFYLARPIAADQRNWPAADYRYGGVFFEDVVHTGVDIPAPSGTNVLAAGPGKVIWAGYGIYRGINDPTDPYGLAIVIRHDFGYQGSALFTVYGHLDRIDVLIGQHLEAGEVIGISGETGKTTGPHLHFEVRIGNNTYFATRNPELWIAPPQGWGILVGRVMDTGRQLVAGQLIVAADQNGDKWMARSYGDEAVNRDDYYQENLVIGDLPAGTYELSAAYAGVAHRLTIQIQPGMVTAFTFYGREGFVQEFPPLPGVDFVPEALP